MKLKISLRPTAITGTSDDSPATTSPSYTSSKITSSDSLQSHLSLQTLPSVPSLQTFSLLTPNDVTLTHSLSATLSLPSSISSLSLSSSHHLFVSSGHLINVYDLPTFSLLETFNSNGASYGTVKSISFCNGKVLTAHQDGKIRVWKLTSKKRHKLVSTLPTLTDKLSRFPLPGNYVQVRRHKTRLWVEHNDAVSGLAVNAKNERFYIYSVSWDKTLKVWGTKSLRCQESITAHEDAINAVVVSFDGVVYTGSADGRIRVWAKGSGSGKRHARIATLEKHKSGVNALALNSEGSILFSGACDRSILVWEREDGGKYMVVSGALRGHDGAILCLINVSDMLMSGSSDRTVRIWRRGCEGKFCCLKVLSGHMKAVKCLGGKMEGEGGIWIFSGGLDGEVRVWRVNIN